jgi:hypothetical protein
VRWCTHSRPGPGGRRTPTRRATALRHSLPGSTRSGRDAPKDHSSPFTSTAPWKMPPRPNVSRVKRFSVLMASFACAFGVFVMSYTGGAHDHARTTRAHDNARPRAGIRTTVAVIRRRISGGSHGRALASCTSKRSGRTLFLRLQGQGSCAPLMDTRDMVRSALQQPTHATLLCAPEAQTSSTSEPCSYAAALRLASAHRRIRSLNLLSVSRAGTSMTSVTCTMACRRIPSPSPFGAASRAKLHERKGNVRYTSQRCCVSGWH